MNKVRKQYKVHTLTGITIPVALKLFESFQPCEGRHGGKLLGFGLVIGTDRNLDAALEIMNEVVSAKWAPHLNSGGQFLVAAVDLSCRADCNGLAEKPIFVGFG